MWSVDDTFEADLRESEIFIFLVKTFFRFLSIVNNVLNKPCIASDILCNDRLNTA